MVEDSEADECVGKERIEFFKESEILSFTFMLIEADGKKMFYRHL
jgi:hypothetical protein